MKNGYWSATRQEGSDETESTGQDWVSLPNGTRTRPMGADEVLKNLRARHRVAHISTVHAADDTRVFLRNVRFLADAGYRVFYAAAEVPGFTAPDDIEVVLLPFTRSRVRRIFLHVPRALLLALRAKADLYHFHDPEMLPVALVMRALGKPVIWDVHEEYRLIAGRAAFVPRPLRPLLRGLVLAADALASRFMTHIVAATPAIARHYPASKTSLVQNFPDLSLFEPFKDIPKAERPTVIYAGAIVADRGVVELVDAMADPRIPPDAELLLIGPMRGEGLRERLEQSPGWARTRYLGKLTPEQTALHMAKAHVGVFACHPKSNFLESQPRKLFEYLAAGCSLVISDFPFWRDLFGDAPVVQYVPPLNVASLATAITNLIGKPEKVAANLHAQAIELARNRFNFSIEGKKLLTIYDRILER